MDKSVLLNRKASLEIEAVDLGDGVIVTVRAMTNGEIRECRRTAKTNDIRYEHLLISTALVDPVMSEEEVSLWLEGDPADPDDVGAPAGDAVSVMGVIQRLSGLSKEEATKSVPPVRKRPKR